MKRVTMLAALSACSFPRRGGPRTRRPGARGEDPARPVRGVSTILHSTPLCSFCSCRTWQRQRGHRRPERAQGPAPDHRAQGRRALPGILQRARSMSPTPATIGPSVPRSGLQRRPAASRSATMPTTSVPIPGATASCRLRQGRPRGDRSSKPEEGVRYATQGHPESFQFDDTGSRIFVNVPGARKSPCSMSPPTSNFDLGDGRSEFELCNGCRP